MLLRLHANCLFCCSGSLPFLAMDLQPLPPPQLLLAVVRGPLPLVCSNCKCADASPSPFDLLTLEFTCAVPGLIIG